jgi:hypothetical protein
MRGPVPAHQQDGGAVAAVEGDPPRPELYFLRFGAGLVRILDIEDQQRVAGFAEPAGEVRPQDPAQAASAAGRLDDKETQVHPAGRPERAQHGEPDGPAVLGERERHFAGPPPLQERPEIGP